MKTKIITLCFCILLIPFIVSAQFETYSDMELGYQGAPVVELQKFLNLNNYIVNPVQGEPGSVGNESTYFGVLTQKALSLFQKDHTITPSLGYFGPKTRAKINEVIQGAEQGELSYSLLAGKQTYTVNYYIRGIPSNPAGCNNKSYNPTIVGSSNTIGPFSYPVKMTFTGSVDDNLMINGIIVDRNMNVLSGGCSGKHSLTYSQNFPANTPIRFNVIDNYGVETSLVGTVTIEPTTPPVSNVKLNTINIDGKITQPNSNGTYQKGDRIEIKAEPNKGYVFEKWTGACSGTKQTCTILMDGNKNVTAVFKAVLKLTFEVKGPGSIKAIITSKYGEKEKEYIFNKTETIEIDSEYIEVKLLAVANENSRVVKWTDDICKRVADPNAKQLFCDGHKEKPTSLAIYLGDSNVTFGVEFAKKIPMCTVIAYNGINSTGVFTAEVERLVKKFEEKYNRKVPIIISTGSPEVKGFQSASQAGERALKDIASVPKDHKILGLFHSISSVGVFNAGIESNKNMKIVLYDPPYNLLSVNLAPAWLLWGNPDAIKTAKNNGIKKSDDIEDLTNGTIKPAEKHDDVSKLKGHVKWLEDNCI